MIHQGARARVREDDRRLREVEDLAHHVRRDVRDVDQHAEPVHLAHHLAPERRQPAVRRGVGRRVGPVVVLAVSERHVADAERIVGAQRAEAVLERLAVLHAEERGDLALLPGALDVGGAGGEEEGVRVGVDHPAGELDLLELGARRVRQSRGDEDAPELARDPALAEPRDVGVDGRAALAQVDPGQIARERLAQRPGQVVVAVDQRHFLEEGARPRERSVLGDERRGGGGHSKNHRDEHQASFHEAVLNA